LGEHQILERFHSEFKWLANTKYGHAFFHLWGKTMITTFKSYYAKVSSFQYRAKLGHTGSTLWSMISLTLLLLFTLKLICSSY
jgi:hypothetical protein